MPTVSEKRHCSEVFLEKSPLSGEVERGEFLQIGYFEQEVKEQNSNTCIEEVWSTFPSYTQYEVRAALAKCGLTTKHIESRVSVLSGGEKRRSAFVS